jgi:hypothetical protein
MSDPDSFRPRPVAGAATLLLFFTAAVAVDAQDVGAAKSSLVELFSRQTSELCARALGGGPGDVERLSIERGKWNYLLQGTIATVDKEKRLWELARSQVLVFRQEMLSAVGTLGYDAAVRRLKTAEFEATERRKTYLQSVAMGTGLASVMEVCDQCLQEVKKPDTPAQAMPAGPTLHSNRPGQCATTEGPLLCTGTFAAEYRSECVISSLNDRGPAELLLHADGVIDVRFTSSVNRMNSPPSFQGRVEPSGRVFIEHKSATSIERWEGQLRVEAAADGARMLLGSGAYTNMSVSTDDGSTTVQCRGTLRLNAGW